MWWFIQENPEEASWMGLHWMQTRLLSEKQAPNQKLLDPKGKSKPIQPRVGVAFAMPHHKSTMLIIRAGTHATLPEWVPVLARSGQLVQCTAPPFRYAEILFSERCSTYILRAALLSYFGSPVVYICLGYVLLPMYHTAGSITCLPRACSAYLALPCLGSWVGKNKKQKAKVDFPKAPKLTYNSKR